MTTYQIWDEDGDLVLVEKANVDAGVALGLGKLTLVVEFDAATRDEARKRFKEEVERSYHGP